LEEVEYSLLVHCMQ